MGSRGDKYENALAATINSVCKAELVRCHAQWATCGSLELATLNWVHWLNYHRMMESLGFIPPVEACLSFYRQSLNPTARFLGWFTLCSFQSEHRTAHMQELRYSLWRHTGTGISLVASVQETVFSAL